MRSIFAACLIGWCCGALQGAEVSIEGHGEGYARQTIEISIAFNPFISDPAYREPLTCDESGRFHHTFQLETGRVVQFEVGVYQAYLYMQPGFHYEVELPPFREKKYEEFMSPYYQPVFIPLKVTSRTDLRTGETVPGTEDVNDRIARFDTAFSKVNEEVILDRRLGRPSPIDSMEEQLEGPFTKDTSGFFTEYRKYRYGILRLNEGKTGLAEISTNYLGPVVRESHPGFIELFRNMFKDFIYYYSSTPEGNGLRRYINRTHQLDSIRSSLMAHPAVWCDTLADMVLLQELSDIFYRGDYHKESILILLDSMENDPVSPKLARYTVQVRDKLSSLMVGHRPPAYRLADLNGTEVTPDDLKGKYTYLFFCTPDHYGCMMEYPYLQSYTEKHADYFQVVSVMVAASEQDVADFMERNGYGWRVLYYGEDPSILQDYMIRAFPTAYLLDPEGNLILSPSPLPSDGFEQQLFRILRSRGDI
ncbi:MAG: TlpA family protein disulfide reductase [Bacteroidales bacterium]